MSKTCTDEEMHSRYRKMRVNGKEVDVHRHVMEQILGRPLAFNENVHHINGNRYDNRPENLELVTPKEHRLLHPHTDSPETRAKKGAATRGRHWKWSHGHTREWKAALSAKMIGNKLGCHPLTPEHKAKIAATLKSLYSTGQRKRTGGRKSKLSGR